jgi:anti-sigma factor RsiW
VKTMCEEKELLVSYLYDDLGDTDRARFEHHVRQCAECRDELDGLRGVRADLTSWFPPQSDLGFRIVREPKVVEMKPRAGGWRAWWTPAAGLAAAATLVLAAASAIAHVEIHRGPDGITVRTGWNTASAATEADASRAGAPAASPVKDIHLAAAPAAPAIDAATVAGLENRIRALEAASHDSGVRAASMLSARSSDDDLIRRMREMMTVSETKQRAELALRVAQLNRDFDAQRIADLNRIQKGFSSIDASVAADAAAHRELTNYFLTTTRQK